MDFSTVDIRFVIWLAILLAVATVVFGVVRFFFHHLLHLLIRGCGLLFLLILLFVILRLFKIV